MAFTVAEIITPAGSGTDAQSYETASGTPTTGRKWYALVVTENSTDGGQAATLSGMGLTWTSIATVAHGGAGSNTRLTQLFEGSGTPSTGTVTITVGGSNNQGCLWAFFEVGAGGTVTRVQVATDRETTASASHTVDTMAALGDAANLVVAYFVHLSTTTIDDGWTATDLTMASHATPNTGLRGFHRTGSNAPSASVASGTERWGSISVEFHEATDVTGTSAVTFGFALSGTGQEEFTGTSAVAFGFSESGTGIVEATGTSDVAFGFATAATATYADVTGTSAVTFGFSLAGTGQEEWTGTSAVTFGFSLSGTAHAPASHPLEATGYMRIDAVARLYPVGAGMPIEVEMYDPQFNPPRLIAVLEGARQPAWTDVLNDPGAFSFSIPAADRKAGERIIAAGNLAKFKLHGAHRFAGWVDQVSRVVASTAGQSGELLTVAGPGAISMLSRAVIAPPDRTENDSFIAVLLGDYIDEAASTSLRGGTLALMSYDWTTTDDSNGDPWDDDADWAFPWNTNLSDVWRAAIGMGIDFRMTPALVLQAYEEGMGTDRSGTIVLNARHLREEVTTTRNESQWFNVAWVRGSTDPWVTVYGDHSDPRRGRREGAVDFSATDSPVALRRAGRAALAQAEALAGAVRLPLHHGRKDGLFEPYLDYAVGDTLGSRIPGLTNTIRVAAITIAGTDGGDFLVDVDSGGVRFDNLVRLRKLIEASDLLRVDRL